MWIVSKNIHDSPPDYACGDFFACLFHKILENDVII